MFARLLTIRAGVMQGDTLAVLMFPQSVEILTVGSAACLELNKRKDKVQVWLPADRKAWKENFCVSSEKDLY